MWPENRARRCAWGALLAGIVMTGCSAEKSDWQSAQSADTIEAYEAFLTKHPQSELATEARERTKQLTEETEWERATAADSIASYQAFLAKYPEGKWSEEARIRVENFNVLGDAGAEVANATGMSPAAPATAATATTADDTPAPKPSATSTPSAATTPKSAPAPAATVATTAARAATAPGSGGFRVQLAALSSESKATTEWHRLTKKFPNELAGLTSMVVAADTAAGKVFRLQANVGAEAQARALCASLSAAQQGCVVVAPK